MKHEDLNYLVHELFRRAESLFLTKNQDYNVEEDALRSFKQMQKMCEILDVDPRRSAEDASLVMEFLKIIRYCNLRGRVTNHESSLDTGIDGLNYWILTLANAIEEGRLLCPSFLQNK